MLLRIGEQGFMKISFASDYTRGAHPRILQALSDNNMNQMPGYGTDIICERAKGKIKDVCGCPSGDVVFLVGGTQTNQIIIDMLLKPYQGIVAAKTGHIASHEAGAIEFSGHKVLTVSASPEVKKDSFTEDQSVKGQPVLGDNVGKISSEELEAYLEFFYSDDNHEHMVFPGAVYISHPTEYGTLYTKKELSEISRTCRKWNLPLFLDGARLGYGLMSRQTDVTIKDISELTDVFYIGGTKVGALFGEAVVFPRGIPTEHPVPVIKQHGALLAKGWLLGLMFDTLFTEDLYFEISKNAIDMAEKLKEGLKEKGYRFFLNSPTNQQFIIVDNEKLQAVSENVGFSFWEKFDEGHTVIRLATDWATVPEDVDELMKYL